MATEISQKDWLSHLSTKLESYSKDKCIKEKQINKYSWLQTKESKRDEYDNYSKLIRFKVNNGNEIKLTDNTDDGHGVRYELDSIDCNQDIILITITGNEWFEQSTVSLITGKVLISTPFSKESVWSDDRKYAVTRIGADFENGDSELSEIALFNCEDQNKSIISKNNSVLIEVLGGAVCTKVFAQKYDFELTESSPKLMKPIIKSNILYFQYEVGKSQKEEKVQCLLTPTIKCNKMKK